MNLRWVIPTLVLLTAFLQYRLWVGEGSLADASRLKREIQTHKEELARLQERNRLLQAEVDDLKSGLDAIEERARGELGMIKEGEVFYQIIQPPPRVRK